MLKTNLRSDNKIFAVINEICAVTIFFKGPVIKYLLGGVEDILGGYVKKSEPLRGVPK